MRRPPLLQLCLFSWFAAGAAWAAAPRPPPESQTRVELALSSATRFSDQTGLGVPVSFSGLLSPGHLRATGAHFLNPHLAIAADVGLDAFGVQGIGLRQQTITVPLLAPQVSAAALGRLRLLEGLAVEGQAGYLVGWLPSLRVGSQGELVGASALLSGPVAGVQVRWDGWLPLPLLPALPVSARAGVRAMPVGLGLLRTAGGRDANQAFQAAADAGVSYRLARVGPAELAVGLSYEGVLSTVSSTAGYGLSQRAHRFGLAITGWLVPPGADARGLDGTLPGGPGRILGKVVRDGNAPIPGARVEIAGREPVVTRSDGRFAVEQVPPGPLAMTVTAVGFKPRAQSVTVTPGGDLQLTVTLAAPTGPGRIKGVAFAAPVKEGAERLPLADVAIQGPRGEVRAAADGTFLLSEVGPGPVQLKASLKGFKPAEEVVSVPPEGEAEVELTLVREAARVLASMRGQVRTLRGKPVAGAWLRVPEAKVNTRTGSDGRFHVRVPGGKYTVVFEAPGYVRQTKIVEVADGDQAIFYVDLSREDR